MAKQKSVKSKKDLHAEIRGVGVLVEQVGHEVRVIAEQYGDIKETLRKHGEKLDSHTDMIGGLAVDVAVLKEDSKATRLNIDVIKTDIEFIKSGLKRKVDVEEFSALERRVALLEKRSANR